MRSDAQRRADAAYRQRHAEEIREKYAYVSVALPPELAEKFKTACAERAVTVNAVLTAAVKKYVENFWKNA